MQRNDARASTRANLAVTTKHTPLRPYGYHPLHLDQNQKGSMNAGASPGGARRHLHKGPPPEICAGKQAGLRPRTRCTDRGGATAAHSPCFVRTLCRDSSHAGDSRTAAAARAHSTFQAAGDPSTATSSDERNGTASAVSRRSCHACRRPVRPRSGPYHLRRGERKRDAGIAGGAAPRRRHKDGRDRSPGFGWCSAGAQPGWSGSPTGGRRGRRRGGRRCSASSSRSAPRGTSPPVPTPTPPATDTCGPSPRRAAYVRRASAARRRCTARPQNATTRKSRALCRPGCGALARTAWATAAGRGAPCRTAARHALANANAREGDRSRTRASTQPRPPVPWPTPPPPPPPIPTRARPHPSTQIITSPSIENCESDSISIASPTSAPRAPLTLTAADAGSVMPSSSTVFVVSTKR